MAKLTYPHSTKDNKQSARPYKPKCVVVESKIYDSHYNEQHSKDKVC